MDGSQLSVLVAEASFGVGMAVGISSGFVTGLLFCAAAGATYASKKIKRQIQAGIDSEDISVVGKDGQPIDADSTLELLNDQFQKA